mmetsp:Transcript_156363/g.272048  ORF Transcript_156363/g.272048 Transcript_156363/m.272048 type:complete len:273 (-) Transcript_156363:414-1232(-)
MQPLEDKLCWKLGEHLSLTWHNVSHLVQKHIRDLLGVLRADATLGVTHRTLHDHCRAGQRLWQGPLLQEQPAELIMLFPISSLHDAKLLCCVGTGNHAVGNAQAMWNCAVTISLLYGMGNGVAVLEDHTTCLLVSICKQDRHLCFDAQSSQCQEGCITQPELSTAITAVAIGALLRESFHKALRMLASKETCVLCQLAKAGKQFRCWQGPAKGHINEDLQRRIERPDVVLTAIKANGSLQRRHNIMHCQQCGGHVNQLGPTIENGGKEACQV